MASPFASRLAREIRRVRRGAGLTQVELADRAALARRTVQRAEAGTTIPTATVLEAIEEALGVLLIPDVSAVAPRAHTR